MITSSYFFQYSLLQLFTVFPKLLELHSCHHCSGFIRLWARPLATSNPISALISCSIPLKLNTSVHYIQQILLPKFEPDRSTIDRDIAHFLHHLLLTFTFSLSLNSHEISSKLGVPNLFYILYRLSEICADCTSRSL